MVSVSVEPRTEFLEAIERLVIRSGNIAPVFKARIADVVTEAGPGFTRGAFTHYWETRAYFESDALHWLAARHAADAGDRVRTVAADLLDQASEVPLLEDLITSAVDAATRSYASGPSLAIMLSIWAFALSDPRLSDELDRSWRMAIETFEEQLNLLLAVYRLRPRPPWTLNQLSYVITSNVATFSARRAISGDDEPLTPALQAEMMLASIRALTEPLDGIEVVQ